MKKIFLSAIALSYGLAKNTTTPTSTTPSYLYADGAAPFNATLSCFSCI